MRKLTFFVHDLAANPIVRAAPLAQAMAQDFEVEIVGLLLTGDEVYAPYREAFEFKTIRCSPFLPFPLFHLRKLSRYASGDVIIACKPLPTTLIPARWASRRLGGRPVVLDVEDDEWSFGQPLSLRSWRPWRERLGSLALLASPAYTRLIHPFTKQTAACTVVSRSLQRRYGGTIVRHGPDEQLFDPARFNTSVQEARSRFRIDPHAPTALFGGMVRAHKGFDVLIEAMTDGPGRQWSLVLAGPPDQPAFQRAERALGIRCCRVGLVKQHDMPLLLHAVDAVPIPQRRSPVTESQVPAKLLEAMSMGKAIVGAEVGDIPEILGHGQRGWLVPAEDSARLSDALGDIAGDPEEVVRRGGQARLWYLQNASLSAIRERLLPIIEQAYRGDT